MDTKHYATQCRPQMYLKYSNHQIWPSQAREFIIYLTCKSSSNLGVPKGRGSGSWSGEEATALVTSPPIGGGRGIVMPMSVCVCVCLFVCVFVCLFVRVFAKFQSNISAISQPIIMKLGIHITYGYTVTDKYFQNFRSKVKVVGRRKVKNVIWPYLGNEWS